MQLYSLLGFVDGYLVPLFMKAGIYWGVTENSENLCIGFLVINGDELDFVKIFFDCFKDNY